MNKAQLIEALESLEHDLETLRAHGADEMAVRSVVAQVKLLILAHLTTTPTPATTPTPQIRTQTTMTKTKNELIQRIGPAADYAEHEAKAPITATLLRDIANFLQTLPDEPDENTHTITIDKHSAHAATYALRTRLKTIESNLTTLQHTRHRDLTEDERQTLPPTLTALNRTELQEQIDPWTSLADTYKYLIEKFDHTNWQ